MELSGFSSSSSWITSMSCSLNPLHSSDNHFDPTWFQWIKFIVVAPCPQRAMLSTAAGLFLLVLLGLALRKLLSIFATTRTSNSHIFHRNHKLLPHTTLWFKLTLSATLLLALSYTLLCSFSFYRTPQLQNMDALCWLIQAISHATVAVLLLHEIRFESARHPCLLRSYWILNFILVFLLSLTALIRLLSSTQDLDPNLQNSDVFLLSTLPLSILLLAAAIRPSTGVKTTSNGAEETPLQEPLLRKKLIKTGFSSASFTSKALFLWLNPLLKKGYISPLKMEDVADVGEEHRAETTSDLFEKHWPKPGRETDHPVVKTLLHCFWKDVVFTAALAVVRLCVMYVGPFMIQKFVDFTSGERRRPYEGYRLVVILLTGKIVEVLSSHHLYFHCQKLGMLMRSTLITALYRKGLRLTCSARQEHGVGQIVNYMSVDAQQLSDMMLQFHSIWMTPLQVTIGCIMLYMYLGKAVITAMVGILGVFVYMCVGARKNNEYQQRIMENKDMRMKATNEMLNNMKVIKFQAWEGVFGERVEGFRGMEYGWLRRFWYCLSGTTVVLWCTPVLVASLAFGTAVAMGMGLDAGKVFTTTSLLRVLQEPMRSFPQAMIGLSQAFVSLGRLDRYMVSRELSGEAVERGVDDGDDGDDVAVLVEGGGFCWDDDGCEAVLKNVDLRIRKGGVTAVVGTVGAGKSSLLASLLGEMCKVSGKVKVRGTTAYVAQTSWIQNGTIEENILFGMPMEVSKYRDVLRVCSLEKDVEMMKDGDQTEIGERGINLSGGQKQRIQLARAVYQDRDIYLLDDVFSAVDAHTGSEIFKECVRGALRNKTVVLVTHQIDFLHNMDLIVVMREGMIVESGSYEDLIRQSVDFKSLVDAHEASMELVEVDHAADFGSSEVPKLADPAAALSRHHSTGGEERPRPAKAGGKLITEEERETGTISMEVYKLYCTEAYGLWGVVTFFLISISWQGCFMASDYWLAHETSSKHATKFDPFFFIKVYAGIASISIILALLRSFSLTFWGLKTTQIFFDRTLQCILRAPMSFFDTTPTGRVLSRTSTDQANLDILVPFFLGLTVSMYITLLSIIIITCQYAWPTTFLLIPLGWLNIWYRGYYISSSRELTRLQSISRTPIIHHFSESVLGVVTIRCFGKQDGFSRENIDRVNLNLRMDFHSFASNEWFGFRLEIIGIVLLCVSALFMIVVPPSIINPENVGLSLSYGLSLNGTLFFAVYLSCLAEGKMVSAERMKQLTEIPSEAAWTAGEERPLPAAWPDRGDVELVDLMVRYRPNSPLVIKGITLGIRGGEKIGVVGRTGGGKSTLVQVFFRLVEACGGRVVVDGIDISTLGLHDLRSRFSIIPQEPVLFEGTVRSNMDPCGLYTDEDLWKSLERCQLKELVSSRPEKLNSPVVENGENWSVGQRQLLCLGRVMLKQSRLLFMDEATASVDSHTDAVIQRIIREDFAARTIISIAHRIPTVMDCDRVLVIDSGRAEEFERPSVLLERKSLFSALVREYANRSLEM